MVVAGGTAGPTCHDKRSSHEASGTKVCPYSHPASPSATSTATPLSTSAELCKTSAKHFKTMCRRPTPPGRHARAHMRTLAKNINCSDRHILLFLFPQVKRFTQTSSTSRRRISPFHPTARRVSLLPRIHLCCPLPANPHPISTLRSLR